MQVEMWFRELCLRTVLACFQVRLFPIHHAPKHGFDLWLHPFSTLTSSNRTEAAISFPVRKVKSTRPTLMPLLPTWKINVSAPHGCFCFTGSFINVCV